MKNYTFKDLVFKSTAIDGMKRAKIEFDNGYGISVVIGEYSYGGDEGLYEVAVLKDDNLCYTSGITDDVIGYLQKWEVEKYITEISNL